MEPTLWVLGTLIISILLIVFTIIKLKFHPFLALLLASFFCRYGNENEPIRNGQCN